MNIKVHYRLMGAGREQLTPPPGCYGVDRSSFADNGIPTTVQCMALLGAVALGYTLSVWTKTDSEEGRKAADAELTAKVRKAAVLLDRDLPTVKLTRA